MFTLLPHTLTGLLLPSLPFQNLAMIKWKGVAQIFKPRAAGSRSALLGTVSPFTGAACVARPVLVQEAAKWVLFGHVQEKRRV